MSAQVEADGFHTGDSRRDAAVRSPRFLDAGRHPLITFTTDRVERTLVSGTLTIRGVARPATLSIVRSEVLADAFTVRATARVDRTAFGVTASPGLVGRHFDLALDVRCVRS